MKTNEFDFIKLKNEIKDLPYKAQLIKIIEARTDYLQEKSEWVYLNMGELSFDEKCKLEIEKIKEIMKL